MKKIVLQNQIYSKERALYNSNNLSILKCRFEGIEDGESALKESKNIEVKDSYFDLRYPFWHDVNVNLQNIEMTSKCRAALWYSKNIEISKSIMNGIKALRECLNIEIYDTKVVSPEFGWKNNSFKFVNSSVESEYAFFQSKNVTLVGSTLNGKYSFQYVKNLIIENSVCNTKDAFWHVKNGLIKNSTINGEYLGWYSDGLTFVNCTISGTQPLCYCKNLKLINCKMNGCDLSFEYSDVDAQIIGHVDSIKNPRSGIIRATSVGEIIKTDDTKYPSLAKIVIE